MLKQSKSWLSILCYICGREREKIREPYLSHQHLAAFPVRVARIIGWEEKGGEGATACKIRETDEYQWIEDVHGTDT